MSTVIKCSQAKSWIIRRFFQLIIIGLLIASLVLVISDRHFLLSLISSPLQTNYQKRPECSCSRLALPSLPTLSQLTTDRNRLSLCSEYATRRGPHQRIISISLFGPKQRERFVLHRTFYFLHLLIKDFNAVYPDGYVLRIHHDSTINATTTICPLECAYPNVDFCDMNDKLYIPAKIWRFIPAGDPLVDISEWLTECLSGICQT